MAKKFNSSGRERSSKEETTSRRKESRSSNGESNSTSDELQIANVALQSLNAALDIRVNDLARANNDLKNLFESTQIATVFVDKQFRVRSFTPAATNVFKLRDSDIGSPLSDLRKLTLYPQLDADIRKTLKQLAMIERTILIDDRHYLARIHPYRNVDDRIAGAVLNFIDVTTSIRAEEALRESESRLKNLLAELQHRVRNTLAIVKSITNRTAEASGSVQEMAAHLVGRLDAFARVQSAVARNPDAGVNLAMIVVDELAAHAVREGEQVTVYGPELNLQPRAAEVVSLAIHELATNAIKHGTFRGEGGGRLNVRWRIEESDGPEQYLRFEWAEDGDGGRPAKRRRRGFGMELLTRSLPFDLGAKTNVRFENSGLHFSMKLPIDHVKRTFGEKALESA